MNSHSFEMEFRNFFLFFLIILDSKIPNNQCPTPLFYFALPFFSRLGSSLGCSNKRTASNQVKREPISLGLDYYWLGPPCGEEEPDSTVCCFFLDILRLGESTLRPQRFMEDNNDTHKKSRHARIESSIPRNLATLAAEYRKLSVDCLKVLKVEMQLETIFHIQEMTHKEYTEDQDAEEPDDFIISLTSQIMRRDEQMAPFVADVKRNYIFGGMCSIAANTSIKALSEMKSINLLGVQQICRNSIALEQALVGIPSINNEVVRHRLDRVQTYYELLNLPFEALAAFIADHEKLFTHDEYSNLLKVEVPGREIPSDAEDTVYRILRS